MKHGHSGYTNGGCRCDICKKAMHAYNVKYRRSHGKAKYEAYSAEYRRRNRDKYHAYGVEYKRRRKEELLAQERSPEGKRRRREREASRRARKLGQFLETVDPMVVYEMYGGRCGICGEFVSSQEFHVDHLIPIARGGLHGYINVQPSHPRCNLSKGAR